MHELSELPAILYEFPKTIPPEVLPFHPVDSAPIIYGLQIAQRTEFHWVIADLGHGALSQRRWWVTTKLNFLQLTPKKNT